MDFGVLYFSRYIREGEIEEDISKEDTTDFNNNLELTKTIGILAFFAPKLYYIDYNIE
jgi:hypothetical protein